MQLVVKCYNRKFINEHFSNDYNMVSGYLALTTPGQATMPVRSFPMSPPPVAGAYFPSDGNNGSYISLSGEFLIISIGGSATGQVPFGSQPKVSGSQKALTPITGVAQSGFSGGSSTMVSQPVSMLTAGLVPVRTVMSVQHYAVFLSGFVLKVPCVDGPPGQSRHSGAIAL